MTGQTAPAARDTAANVLLALELLLTLAILSQEILTLIKRARLEGRDISNAELDALQAREHTASSAFLARGG